MQFRNSLPYDLQTVIWCGIDWQLGYWATFFRNLLFCRNRGLPCVGRVGSRSCRRLLGIWVFGDVHGIGVWESFGFGELIAVFGFRGESTILVDGFPRNDRTLSRHLLALNFIILSNHNYSSRSDPLYQPTPRTIL